MSRLSAVNFRILDNVLRKLGFEPVRQKGSHVFYRHPDGRTTTLPRHGGRDIARPLLREVLREMDLTPEEFAEVLKDL
jgi:predicted RNA binding protein YcfA (HicA-like mRNA interferase family)